MRNKLLMGLLLAGGCMDTEPLDQPDESELEARVGSLGNFSVAGQEMQVFEFPTLPSTTQRIAACGHGVLFATRSDNSLWFNANEGIGTWTQVTGGAKGTRIACDRSHLYSMTSGGTLYHALVRHDGQLVLNADNTTWKSSVGGQTLTLPTGTDEIQGGNGNLYALAINSAGVAALSASQHDNPSQSTIQGTAGSWVTLATNLGSAQVTGAGSKITHISNVHDGLTYRKRNRAFGVNPNNSLYYNDSMLYGQNGWTALPNTGLDIKSITAESADRLYVLAAGSGNRRLVRISFDETNCTDNIDNDGDGETDAEDKDCVQPLANDYCVSRPIGSRYCMDRIDSSNPNALVTCNGAFATATVDEGVCTRSSTSGQDSLAPDRANTAPAGTGQYCNVHNPDGTWDFEWEGSDPCATLAAKHPNSKVVRAGLYSTTGENSIAIKCTNGGVAQSGVGKALLVTQNNAVGHTANRCVVTVSPRYMQIFQSPIVTGAWSTSGNRGYGLGHLFDHIPSCAQNDPNCPCTNIEGLCRMSLGQFGNTGQPDESNRIDLLGKWISDIGLAQNAYDFSLDEGTPLKSLGYGTVVTSRSRELYFTPYAPDPRKYQAYGTKFQDEVYIRYDVGSNPTYKETFIAYYGHLQSRSVVDGQTVKPGQVIGYSGTTGNSTGPHLHFGVIRLTNTNGQKPSTSDSLGHTFGYRVPFSTNSSLVTGSGFNNAAFPFIVDPYGWRAPGGTDPNGYLLAGAATDWDGVTGWGAWSPNLFSANETPPYPGL